MKLEGKVAIVTGTSPNIGAGIAGGLAEEGATVVCVDVVPDNAIQCARWIEGRGGKGPPPNLPVRAAAAHGRSAEWAVGEERG